MSAPRFSVLTCVHDPPPAVLAECLASVRDQAHPGVEHVVVDDASRDTDVRRVLEGAARDPAVRLARLDRQSGIVGASNAALAAARGEFVVLLDHDDLLAGHALASLQAAIDDDADVVYSDHDMIRPDGSIGDPFYKPDYSPERLRQHNYITHLVAIRRSLVEAVGGFRAGTDGAQDHDLLLRTCERARSIVHVPEVLYHWRMAPGSVALDETAKGYAYEHGLTVVADHCHRVGLDATVGHGAHLGTYRVRRTGPERRSTSLLVRASGDTATVWGVRRPHLGALLDSLPLHEGPEVIVVSPDPDRIADDRIGRVVRCDRGELGFELAAAAATGELSILLDEAMMLESGLGELTSLLDGDVAAVGSAQFHPDGCVRHAGITTQGTPAHVLYGWHRDHGGPGRLMTVNREVAGIDLVGSAWRTADVRTFERTGVRDSAQAGVRACRSALAAGQRVLWTPFTSFVRADRPPAGLDHVAPVVPWPEPPTLYDPYYNRNLVDGRGDWLERPGRAGAPAP